MKTKSFHSFLRDYAKDMSPKHSLSLAKNERHVKNNARLLNVFSFYVWFDEDARTTLRNNPDKYPHLYQKHLEYQATYKDTSLNNVARVVESLDEFDELKQLYMSYVHLHLNKDEILKRVYHKNITLLKQQKNLSNYRIYTDLKMNPGNANDFLTNANLKKLSMDKIKSIHSYVASV